MIKTENLPYEHEEQAAIFRWSEVAEHEYPELRLLEGSLNGIRLPVGLAVKAKKQGLKKGFPDIRLAVARHGFHSLCIELKRIRGGRVSPEQKEILDLLNSEGNMAIVCNGADEAIKAIVYYLKK